MAEPASDALDLGSFGFDDAEAWLHQFREAAAPAELGTLGSYTLLGELGRGGQGVVYRARQPGTGRDIALKRLTPGATVSDRARRRFEREIEAAAALNHPNIVTAYAADTADGVPLLAMELVEGEPFTAWARGRPWREVVGAFADVCDAVHHAHARGVIHRDLKPSNILISAGPPPLPKVLDFGLARRGEDGEASAPGQFFGTPAYAPPEQVQGRSDDVDARSDIYALGVVLREALGAGLQGAPPATGERPLSRPIRAILDRATAPDPAHRYPAVSALAEDLGRCLAGQPVSALPASAADLVSSLARRNPTATVAFALCLVTLIAAAAGLGWMALRLNEQRRAALDALDREAAALKTALVVNDYMSNVLLYADPNRVGTDSTTIREVLDRAAASADASLGAEPRAAAIVHQKLGMAFAGLSRFDAAETEFRKSLMYFKKHPGEQGADLVEATRYLGATLISLGRLDEAAPLCEEAVQIARGMTTGDGSGLVSSLNDLADARVAQGRTSEAEVLYRESLALVEKLGYARSIKAACAWRGLGSALLVERRCEEAGAAFKSAFEINAEALGPTSPVAASDLANLGQALRQCGDLAGAEEALVRALDLLRSAYKAGSPSIDHADRALRAVREARSGSGDASRSSRP